MTIKVYKIGESWMYDYHQASYILNCNNFLNALSKLLNKEVIYIKVNIYYVNTIGFKFGFFYSHCCKGWIASYTLHCFIQIVSPCCMEPLSIPKDMIPISRNLNQIIEITDIKGQ